MQQKTRYGGVAALVCPMLILPTLQDIRQTPPGSLSRLSTLEMALRLLNPEAPAVHSPVPPQRVQSDLLLNDRNLSQGKYWTVVTQAFVHLDSVHLLNNLSIVVPAGLSIARYYGRW